ncbi:MAG: choice-of-anchor Q domain-containing protein [Candidatus Caldarchaeum sp.]
MIFLIWVVTLAPLPWPVTPVMGATFNVNTTADTTDVNPGDGTCADSSGNCSLRAAIQEANAQAGSDTIILQPNTTYTLSLDATAGDEDLADEDDLDIVAGSTITIQGNRATIRRDPALGCTLNGSVAAGEFRIFEVPRGGDLTLRDVTVRNGCADGANGGGIDNLGTVTITNSTISGNSANYGGGGIGNAGGIAITNSTISGNSARQWGGGIINFGTVIITNSTISGNSADLGGGIINANRVTLTNSTISNNSANYGGGIYNYSVGTVTLTNSTISGNRARGFGGGIYNQEGTVNASFVTIANNSAGSGQGGGIFHVLGTVNIKNSIVGNNTAGDCSGSISSSGGNYDSDGSCFGGSGDVIFLGPLQNNGGPTQTHALLGGDPLGGAADCTDVSNNQVNADQRGSPRLVGGQCDAGAYELQNPRTLSVTINGTGTVTSNPGRINCPGTCTETYEQNTIVQLTATPGPGWVFEGWSGDCSTGCPVTMNMDKACTATFVQQGTIVIQKTAIGGNDTFGFSGSSGIGSFSITTSSGSGARSFSLAPGTYTVTENTPPTGWAFQRLVCTDPDGGTTVDLNTRTATIDLDAGETVTCTFTNTRLGR